MESDRKIEILNKRIDLLLLENEELKAENKRLNDRIYLGNNINKESLDAANKMLICLEAKKEEFDGLIRECAELKETYNNSIKEMYQLMDKYKKDISDVRRAQIIYKFKHKFG